MPASPPGRLARAVAWLGGGAFLLSQIATLFSFFVRMRVADEPAGALYAVVADVSLFSIFALHHSLLARSGAKRWVVRIVPPELERSLYVWIASLLLLMVLAGWQPVPGRAYHHVGLAAAAHWLIVGVGLWITVRAARVLDPLRLAGIRQLGSDPNAIQGGQAPQIETTGFYGWVRHPIYLGWILTFFGTPDMTWTRFVFALVSSAYLFIAVPFEERSLLEIFGQTYADYQRTVRWRIVPGVW
jgi:protein-S-isoprenylcysteine O-methyltransferase Ste14